MHELHGPEAKAIDEHIKDLNAEEHEDTRSWRMSLLGRYIKEIR